MPSNYWLKLYHEILDDPKMGRLDDHTFRRVIEVFLLAGDLGTEHGDLPSVEDMAWRLRCKPGDIAADLMILMDLGIVSKDEDDHLYITQWSQRQAPASPAERQQRHRKRSRTNQYYGNEDVTKRDEPRNEPVTIRNTELDTDTELDTEKIEIVSADVSAPSPSPSPSPSPDPVTDSGVPEEAQAPAQAPAKQKAKRKRESKADPRTQHPAIQAYKAATGGRRYPNKELYDRIIETLGDDPDIERLTACRVEWVSRGFKTNNYAWLFDWYENGIPAGRAPRGTPGASNAEVSSKEWQDYADELARVRAKSARSTEGNDREGEP